MCGIFGYAGKDPGGIKTLLGGVKNLEHRGYDSMGMAFIVEGEEHTLKISTENKSEISHMDLRAMISDDNIRRECFMGIAHTRWASCGEVTNHNAHPHADKLWRCSVVHNGNIENYRVLKSYLQKFGVEFASETDTEVIAHLFARLYRGDAPTAGRQVMDQLGGANAFVVMVKDKSPKLLAVNRGGTLLIGKGPKGTVVTSDPLALPNWVEKRIDLESHEVAVLDEEGCEIFRNGSKVLKSEGVCQNNHSGQFAADGSSVMLKEIFEQPEVLRNTMAGRFSQDKSTTKLGGLEMMDQQLRRAGMFYLIGCGTAHFACQYAAELFHCFGIPAHAGIASEFRHLQPRISVFGAEDVFVFLSQSGETADVIAALERVKGGGNPTLGIVNVVDSKIARMTDAGIYTRAGIERGVASTKAYTAHLVTVALMALNLARQRQMTIDMGRRIISELESIPEKVERILAQNDLIRTLARKYRDMKSCYFLGRYFNFISAQEGALKLKEISYIHAESYPLGEMKHGPLALVDENFCSIVVAPEDSVLEKSIANIREIRARRGKVVVITSEKAAEEMRKIADDVVIIPKTLEYLSPILTVIPLQLFAYHMAVELGRNPDKPRNLAKTVTVE